MQTIDPHAVGSHYSQGQLAVRLTEALRQAGKNPDAPTTADLAGVAVAAAQALAHDVEAQDKELLRLEAERKELAARLLRLEKRIGVKK